MNVADIEQRAQSYGMLGKTIDGNDAMEVYREAVKAADEVRKNGPMLLVCETYRIHGHSKSDKNVYRTAQEIAQWREKDPIARMRTDLLAEGGLSAEELDGIDCRAREAMDAALAFAQSSPYPSTDTICDGVYA